jgi:hypothetical protein
MGTPITPNQSYQLISNASVPDEGPKAVPILLDFSGAISEYDLDLTNFIQRKFITMVQTIFIDLSNSAADDLIVTVGNSNQIIHASKGTQGYYQILAPNFCSFKFNSTANTTQIPIFLINVPIAGVVWTT